MVAIALRGDDVLRAPRNPMERPEVAAGGDLGVRPPRLRHRQVLRQGDDAVQERVVLLEPREIHLGERDRDVTCLCADELREMADGPERGVLEIRRSFDFSRRARAELGAPGRALARHARIEVERQGNVVGERVSANFPIAREVLVHPLEHRLLLGLGEVEARELRRFANPLEGRRTLRLHLRPQRSREESRGEAEAREVIEKLPAARGVIHGPEL